MRLIELLSALLFTLSTGLLFSERFRKKIGWTAFAALIAVTSSVFTIDQAVQYFWSTSIFDIVNGRPPVAKPQPDSKLENAKIQAENAERQKREAEAEADRQNRAAEQARSEAERKRREADAATQEAARQRREAELQDQRRRSAEEAARVEAERRRQAEIDRFFVFSVCNRTGSAISIALDYFSEEDGAPVVRGWKTVEAGQCPELGKFPRGEFHFFAKERFGQKQWSGTFPICVEFPGPFKRIRLQSYNCPNPRNLKRFIVKVVDSPTWTANINP